MQEKRIPRQRFTPAQRAKLLTAYRQGAITQREFALQNNLSVSCLQNWLRKSAPPGDVASSAAFIQLPGGLPMAGASRPAYKILFLGGHSLEVDGGFRAEEVAQLSQILRAL